MIFFIFFKKQTKKGKVSLLSETHFPITFFSK